MFGRFLAGTFHVSPVEKKPWHAYLSGQFYKSMPPIPSVLLIMPIRCHIQQRKRTLKVCQLWAAEAAETSDLLDPAREALHRSLAERLVQKPYFRVGEETRRQQKTARGKNAQKDAEVSRS